MNFTAITNAVDFTTVTAAVGIVFAAIAGLYMFMKGAKLIISALKGA